FSCRSHDSLHIIPLLLPFVNTFFKTFFGFFEVFEEKRDAQAILPGQLAHYTTLQKLCQVLF
ncbi:MAG: hypothetical protein J6B77_06630, partial [Clostridia bacterium]|nr:hypothetical protein [Clostridia bacterium]